MHTQKKTAILIHNGYSHECLIDYAFASFSQKTKRFLFGISRAEKKSTTIFFHLHRVGDTVLGCSFINSLSPYSIVNSNCIGSTNLMFTV